MPKSDDKYKDMDKLSEETPVLKGEKARLNITIDKKLADLAKAQGINISGTLERLLIFRIGRDIGNFDQYHDKHLI